MIISIKNFLPGVKRLLNSGQERSVKAKKNIVQMAINKGLSLFLSLLFLPLFLNCLDTVHYGIWVAIFTLVNWIGFFDIGIGQGLRNKLAESLTLGDFKSAKAYISTAYISVASIFTALIILFLVISPFVDWSRIVNSPDNLINETNQLIIVVVCIMSVNFIVRVFNSVLFALQMPAIISYSDLASQGLCLIFIYFLSRTEHAGSILIFGLIMTITPTIVISLISFIFFRTKLKYISPSLKYFDKSKIKSILLLGGSFFIIQISWIVLTQSNNIIIANIAGPENVAEYYVVFRYMSILLMGFTILTTPIWSAVTEAYQRNDIRWIKRTVRTLTITLTFFIIVGITMIIFSHFAFKIWINNKIPINLSLLILTLIYMIIQMLWSIFGSVINGIGKIRFQFFASIISACVHIPLALFLGNRMGATGVMLSLVIVSLTYALWAPYQYKALLNKTAKGIWNK